ncbi:MAG: SDR family NAD(P)-dependent oxidoreductase, partial [Boseongicola sp. SB0676_bin_33]|nr:SDR family NAD(P)-dependent oxidoreductase [Boseongicola sp. SB0676_bin_33]
LADPALSRELCQACLDVSNQGELPAIPVTEFPYRDYAKALRLMTSGQHQGKLVLKAPSCGDDPAIMVADVRPLLDPEATYLVTGGLGGFGLRLLPYLAFAGARHITLLDRDPDRQRTANWIRESSALVYTDLDVEFDIVAGDVAVEEDVRRCIAQLKRPLKGVFHLAGILDDRFFDDISPESMSRVFAPKADGALHLHRAASGLDLDHFVLFSSTASTIGNPGQVNYSAASAFLDGLAVVRHRQGLPCLAFNMAAVADAGMASRSLHVLRMMRATGMPPVSSDSAIANLDFAMRSMADRDHLVTAMFTRPAWTVELPDYMRTGRMLNNQDAFEAGTGSEWTIESVLAQLAAKVAELCGHDEGGVEEPLSSFGLTSISVAELGAFIQTQFNYQMSALELMTTASCMSIARGIIHGGQDELHDQAEAEEDGALVTPLVVTGELQRAPSAFASAIEDHFPRQGSNAQVTVPCPG